LLRPARPMSDDGVASGEWRELAACRDVELSVFFSPDTERGAARAARESRALQICGACPARPSCRAHALAVEEPYGVWGGMTEKERRLHARRARTGERRPSAGASRRPPVGMQAGS
jgi:WhiB family redox-sensing transcriptional regulator